MSDLRLINAVWSRYLAEVVFDSESGPAELRGSPDNSKDHYC